ncbi:MAG TPA: winged helix-turn-helix domain-containing protein, partial [Streptomyces sp.]|nr:winged helix-turn-helix domain-containing protein [Streptomyces sp.]
VRTLEGNRTYLNLSPYGEPQLGRRGLYGSLGGRSDTKQGQMAMLWVLNLSDGDHSLLDIAERSGLPFNAVEYAAQALRTAGLVEEKA